MVACEVPRKGDARCARAADSEGMPSWTDTPVSHERYPRLGVRYLVVIAATADDCQYRRIRPRFLLRFLSHANAAERTATLGR